MEEQRKQKNCTHDRLRFVCRTNKSKKQAVEKKKARVLKEKEELTSDMIFIGLWRSFTDMYATLAEIDKKTEQVKAIKSSSGIMSYNRNILTPRCLVSHTKLMKNPNHSLLIS